MSVEISFVDPNSKDSSHRGANHSVGCRDSSICNNAVGSGYAHGEHSLTYREVESLCCTIKTKVTLCVNHTSINNEKFLSKKIC